MAAWLRGYMAAQLHGCTAAALCWAPARMAVSGCGAYSRASRAPAGPTHYHLCPRVPGAQVPSIYQVLMAIGVPSIYDSAQQIQVTLPCPMPSLPCPMASMSLPYALSALALGAPPARCPWCLRLSPLQWHPMIHSHEMHPCSGTPMPSIPLQWHPLLAGCASHHAGADECHCYQSECALRLPPGTSPRARQGARVAAIQGEVHEGCDGPARVGSSAPIAPSPHRPITPSPHRPITPSPHHPITASPHRWHRSSEYCRVQCHAMRVAIPCDAAM